MMKTIVASILFVFICLSANAQDAYFSQYYNTSSYLNPAVSGIFEGHNRIQISYRDQWSGIIDNSGFETMLLSYDQRIRMGSNVLTIGALVLNDRVGADQYRHNIFRANASYDLQLSGNAYRKGGFTQFLAAGFNAGFEQYRMSSANFWFGNQYDIPTNIIDQSINSSENIMNGMLSTGIYMDLGFGLIWYATMGSNSIYASISAQHVNRPDISLLGATTLTKDTKWVANMGGEWSVNPRAGISVMPSILWLAQGTSTQITSGLQLRYAPYTINDIGLRVGIFNRMTNSIHGLHIESLIWSANLEYKNTQIAFSYDSTLSELSQINRNRGAFELSLMYVRPSKQRTQRISCPRF